MNITLDEVCDLVGLNLGVKGVKGSDYLQENLGAQSLDIANIAAAIDRKYEIFLDESDLSSIKTVADLHREMCESGD